jgi:hypothetical protein
MRHGHIDGFKIKYPSKVFVEICYVTFTSVSSNQVVRIFNKIIHKTPKLATLDMSYHLIFVVRCDFTEIQ